MFPDITLYLEKDTNSSIVARQGGRHPAKVLLNVYNNIPIENTSFRKKYCEEVDMLLNKEYSIWIAPEVLTDQVWRDAEILMSKLFADFGDDDIWVDKCCNIFNDITNNDKNDDISKEIECKNYMIYCPKSANYVYFGYDNYYHRATFHKVSKIIEYESIEEIPKDIELLPKDIELLHIIIPNITYTTIKAVMESNAAYLLKNTPEKWFSDSIYDRFSRLVNTIPHE